MNYLPFCGYWFYVGSGAGTIPHFYNSWGLLAVLPTLGAALIPIFMAFYRRLRS